MSGKGKKKSKPMSLSEFHANTPSATSTQETAAAAPQLVRINWADEMEKLDDNQPPVDFVFDRSALPTATKSLLQQDINLENVPKKPPFTAYLSNISFEADEEKIRAFFKDLKVETVRLPNDHGRPKGYGYVDFADRDSLIAALSKNEQLLNNRPLKVSLENKQNNRERPGFNNNNSGPGDGPLKSDEADWRRREPNEPEVEEKPAFSGYQSYHSQHQNQNQPNRYQNRGDRGGDREQGFHQRGNYQPRNPNPWQVAGGGGGRDQEFNRNYDDGPKRRQFNNYNKDYQNKDYQNKDYQNKDYQNKGYNDQNRERRPYRISDPQAKEGEQNADNQGGEAAKLERPKLVLAPRTLPVEEPVSQVAQSSIFGGAKPVDTAARERQIEERIKEKEKDRTSESNTAPENPEEEGQKTISGTEKSERSERSHKISTTSVDSQNQEFRSPPHQQNRSNQDSYNKPRNYNKDNRNRGGLQQSGSFTSPPHQQHQNQPRSHEKPPREYVEAPRPSENAWKKPASNLFSETGQEQNPESSNEDRGNNAPVRNQSGRQPDDANRRPYNPNKRIDSAGHRPGGMNRDNKDKRPPNSDRSKQFGRNQRGDRQFNNRSGPGDKFSEPRAPRPPQHLQQQDDITDFQFGNKFSGLQIDVEEDDNM